jgi:hypothetical protein
MNDGKRGGIDVQEQRYNRMGSRVDSRGLYGRHTTTVRGGYGIYYA